MLCCHNKVHHDNLRIYGYIQTNEGIQLNYEYINKDKIINNKKKFTDKDIEIIMNYKDDILNKKISKNNLIKKLELTNNIKISSGTLKKILNNEY